MTFRPLPAICLACATLSATSATWESPPARLSPAAPSATTPPALRPYVVPGRPAPGVAAPPPAAPTMMPRTQVPARVPPTMPAPAAMDRTHAPAFDHGVNLHSQHLDVETRGAYAYGFSYSPKTTFGPFGDTHMVGAEFDLRLFRFHEFLGGRFDAWASGQLIGFVDNPDIDALPDALVAVAIDIGQTWRFINGWSTEIRAAPGIYSDITEPTFGIPLTLNCYFAVDPELSVLIGGTFRPGWAVPILPNIGLAWQPHEIFRLEAMLPKSRVALFPGYLFSVFGTFEWQNITYGLADKEGLPDALTLNDIRASAGLTVSPFGDYTISAEVGTYLQRKLSADVEADKSFSLSKENFFRFMVKGSF